MNIFVSSLIKGFGQMEEIAAWVDQKADPALGVELIAFTHDEAYWERLCRLLPKLHCRRTFHGPYIGVEATSKKGTAAYDHLLDSYRRVSALAAEYSVEHVVFHYTQKGVTEQERAAVQEISRENIRRVLAIGKEEGAEILVENLPNPPSGERLYDNEGYMALYREIPELLGLIDMGHAVITGLDVEKLLQEEKGRVHAYHFHNNDGKRDLHNALLEGVIDYKAFAEVYKRCSPDARIVLEYEPHAWVSEDALSADIAFVKEHFQA